LADNFLDKRLFRISFSNLSAKILALAERAIYEQAI